MDKTPQFMPSLATQLSLAIFTSLVGCGFIFLFAWQRQLPDIVGISAPLSLSLLVLLGLAGSILLIVALRRLPEFKLIGRIDPERQMKIVRLLRADAYTYLLLPILVIVTLAWQQIGNTALFWMLALVLLLLAKCAILLEMRKLNKKI